MLIYKMGRNSANIDIDLLRDLYINKKLSILEITDILPYSRCAIHRCLVRNNIPRRRAIPRSKIKNDKKYRHNNFKIYCKKCSSEYYTQIGIKRYRLINKELFIEKIERNKLYKRDNGICGICKNKVNKDNFHVDHIIPISKGGEHSYKNTQISHPSCNLSKGSKLL